MAAKDTQNLASNAKRCATTLRHIASYSSSVCEEDRGIMLAAARAVEAYAKARSADAKRQKVEEAARDAFIKKATAEAAAALTASWSTTTLLDKAGILAADNRLYTIDHIIKFHRHGDGSGVVNRQLMVAVRDVIDEEARFAAYQAFTKNMSIAAAIAERTQNLATARSRPPTIAAAERISRFIDSIDKLIEAA